MDAVDDAHKNVNEAFGRGLGKGASHSEGRNGLLSWMQTRTGLRVASGYV